MLPTIIQARRYFYAKRWSFYNQDKQISVQKKEYWSVEKTKFTGSGGGANFDEEVREIVSLSPRPQTT